jgi:hypothetical protein
MISKRTLAKLALGFIVLAPLAIPLLVSASTGANTTPSLWPTGFWGPLVSCTGNYINGSNQCTNLCDFILTVIRVLYFVMSIAIFIATPILIIWGGIMIMISGASPEMLGTGKKIITGTLIGLAIILCSYLLVSTFLKALGVTSIGGFGGPACTING